MSTLVTPRFRTAVDRLIFIEDSSGTGKVTNAEPGRGGSGERTV